MCPMPLPDDIIHLAQAARPDDRLLNLANGRTVILDRALSTSHLGHALQYHADCRVHLWRGGVAALLPPAKLATVDVETLDTVAEPLPRAFVSYTYDHVDETAASIPLPPGVSGVGHVCTERRERQDAAGEGQERR